MILKKIGGTYLSTIDFFKKLAASKCSKIEWGSMPPRFLLRKVVTLENKTDKAGIRL
jgi:hypothetical protein